MYRILSLSNTLHIAKDLGELVYFENKQYASGEYITIINERIEGDVVVMGNITGSNIMEFISMIDAAKRAGGERIILIIPYFGYARQDKIEKPYSSVGFEIIAKMINAFKVDKLITVDIHNPDMLDLFDCDTCNVSLHSHVIQHLMRCPYHIIAPDQGSYKRIKNFFTNIICLNKNRSNILEFTLSESVKDKRCFVIEDIIDTGSTMKGAIDCLYKNGAKDVKAYATHILGNYVPKEVVLTTDSLGKRQDIQTINLAGILTNFL